MQLLIYYIYDHVAGRVNPDTADKDAAARAQSRRPQRVRLADVRRGWARTLDSRTNTRKRPKPTPSITRLMRRATEPIFSPSLHYLRHPQKDGCYQFMCPVRQTAWWAGVCHGRDLNARPGAGHFSAPG